MAEVKMIWQGFKERAAQLRQSSDELKRKAQERSASLPELALAAEDDQGGGRTAFHEAVNEVDHLIAQARQAQFAAVALDERADQTRKEDREFERNARTREMSDARAAYDHATNEMDRALADVEDAYRVLRDATTDLAGALRRAEFADGAGALQRRAPRMLVASSWANAPTLTKALGVEHRLRHHAQNMAEASTFLPEPETEQ